SLTSVHPGLCFQIGHPPGEECDFRDGPHKMVALDDNVIHQVAIDFCGCIDAPSKIDHLL
ncbi:hypothetical protein DFH08DRAFT_630686, partial [Mycena albidolilacea]